MWTTGYRNYVFLNDKDILVTWSDRHCEKCQRFLAKHQQKYCKKCSLKIKREQEKIHHRNHPEYEQNRKPRHDKRSSIERGLRDKYYSLYHSIFSKVYQNAGRFNIGDCI